MKKVRDFDGAARKAATRLAMVLVLGALVSACAGPRVGSDNLSSALCVGGGPDSRRHGDCAWTSTRTPAWSGSIATNETSEGAAAPLPVAEPVAEDEAPGTDNTPVGVESEELPYLPSDIDDTGLKVSDDNVLLASAATVVSGEEELDDMRGGFLTAAGLEINFGIQMQTLVNGATQLASALTLDDIVANHITSGTNLGSVKLTSTDAANISTFINHTFNGSGIGATVVNSENGIDISNFATLTIDIVGIGRTGANGVRGSQLRNVNHALRQAIIMGLAK